MVNSNIQREHVLPSEKAFAYKMRMEAMKHQGKATSSQLGTKLRTLDAMGKEVDESRNQIHRYIRLTYAFVRHCIIQGVISGVVMVIGIPLCVLTNKITNYTKVR